VGLVSGWDGLGPKVIRVDEDGNLQIGSDGFSIGPFDYVELLYTGDDLTGVIYKRSGSTVATLVLSYEDGKLKKVEKT
jgi:hypothetical protein